MESRQQRWRAGSGRRRRLWTGARRPGRAAWPLPDRSWPARHCHCPPVHPWQRALRRADTGPQETAV